MHLSPTECCNASYEARLDWPQASDLACTMNDVVFVCSHPLDLLAIGFMAAGLLCCVFLVSMTNKSAATCCLS